MSTKLGIVKMVLRGDNIYTHRNFFVPLQTEMPFINNILNYRSLSIVGLEKNTGKTVCLNYILRRLNELKQTVAVTSIGVDGEQTDAVFATAKPEITLYEGTQFITSEKHYLSRRLVSELLHVDTRTTSLGRLVTGRVICPGKILLSGAATTEKLRQQIESFRQQGMPLTIVDGALSRLSLASPTVTDAMILATGGAVSTNIKTLINKTRFVYQLINLEEVDIQLQQLLVPIAKGLWGVDANGIPHDLGIASAFLLGKEGTDLFQYGTTIFAAGAISDRLLKHLTLQKNVADILLIARDFTKLFLSPEVLSDYLRKGGQIKVLQRSKLIAITLNPTSPSGYRLNSVEACAQLSEALQTPVYDVMRSSSLN